MKTRSEPFEQTRPNLASFDLEIMQGAIGSATQKTGFDQRIYEETQSRYDLIKRIDSLENKVEKLEKLFKVSSVPINSLNDSKFRLIKPIDVSIEQRGREEFIACLYDAELYGYGECIPEALEDLKVAIVNQFNFLIKQESGVLGHLPLKQLEFLSSIVATNA